MRTNKLSKTFLEDFTDHPQFSKYLEEVLEKAMGKINVEKGQREDSLAETGMIGLAVHCKEKSQRIFNKLAGKRRSTDKFQHEVYDSLTYSILLTVYMEMLNAGESSPTDRY